MIYTIGFTQKNAQKFFGLLKGESVNKLIDVRLNNVSQLAGFAKRDDLKFFLDELCNIEYEHRPDLAPTNDILKLYKKGEMSWESYEDKFLNLMSKRRIEQSISRGDLEHSCLLCSEHKPHNCHRQLVLNYLNESWGTSLEVKHLY